MKPIAFTVTLPLRRRRAIELYAADSLFRGRRERNVKIYSRRVKHPGKDHRS